MKTVQSDPVSTSPAPAAAPAAPSTFTQVLYSGAGAEVPATAKYIFGCAPITLPDLPNRQMVGVVMTAELASEASALRNDPRVKHVPALQALLSAFYRNSRTS